MMDGKAQAIKDKNWDRRYALHQEYLKEVNLLIEELNKAYDIETDLGEKEEMRSIINEGYQLVYEMEYHIV